MCGRDRKIELDEDRQPYWPRTSSSLDHTIPYYLQSFTSLLLLPGQDPLQAVAPLGAWQLVSVTDRILTQDSILNVTYWPSTEPSIKRCTCVTGRRCIRSRISEYRLDLWTGLNSVQMRTPTGSRGMSNNYIIRCNKRFESVGVRGKQSSVRVAVTVWVLVAVGDKMP